MKGHIRPRGPGAWELKFDVPSENGDRKTRYITVRGGKRDAQKKLTELLDQVNKGSFIDPSKTTLAEFLDRWEGWAATQVSAKTLERYKDLLAHHVRPHHGVVTDRYKLVHFEGPDLDEWELFDLQADPRELRNAIGDPANAKVVGELKAELARLRSDEAMDRLAPEHSAEWRNLGVSVLHVLVLDSLLRGLGTSTCRYVHLLREVLDDVAARGCIA